MTARQAAHAISESSTVRLSLVIVIVSAAVAFGAGWNRLADHERRVTAIEADVVPVLTDIRERLSRIEERLVSRDGRP